MKKIIGILFSTLMCVSAYCCWFTQDNFNNTYISGIGNYNKRYNPSANISETVYYNNIKTSLPCAVWFVVKERIKYVNDVPTPAKIVIAELWYKVLPSGSETPASVWRLAKKIDNPKFNLSFNSEIKLFGETIISKKLAGLSNIKSGDKIMLVWRITDEDGVTSGDAFSAGSSTPVISIPDIAHGNVTSEVTYTGNYTAPFVTIIEYNGGTTPNR